MNKRTDNLTIGMSDDTLRSSRKISLTAGLLYLLTFIAIATLTLYGPVHDPNYILGPGPDTNIIIGVIFEMIVALAGIGTAVVLYPILKRESESLALGFVGARTLEASAIFVGIAALLSIVTLRQAGASVDALAVSHALVALYDRTFLIGQSCMPAINGLLLGTLLYRTRLVPRILPLIGLIGAPLLLASQIAVMFGLIERVSTFTILGGLPIALWEFSLGLWLTFKGFSRRANTSPLH